MKPAVVLSVFISVLLLSCKGDGSLLPKSGGRPYEVLVVADDTLCRSLIDSILSTDAVALPQSEPAFDVSTTDGRHFNETAKLARNIVIVTADPGQFTVTRVRYEKNVWARPQMVVYVNTPSTASLQKDIGKLSRPLLRLLERAETNNAIATLQHSGNTDAEQKIKKMFGADMKIPADMKAGKNGKDFLWFSDNGTASMSSICVYSYKGDKVDMRSAIVKRDSIMRLNIPGERAGMYMQTASDGVTAELANERGRRILICRGLWEMRGDAMGGPFVSHSLVDTLRHRVIVAEAFVYAPGVRKRNLIRQAEAALYTLKFSRDNKTGRKP